jgi:hypothetical protein
MCEKYIVGSKLKLGRDVADLMMWLEKRIKKRSSQPIDLAFLSIIVAEISVLFIREYVPFYEPIDEGIADLKVNAKEIARKMFYDLR